MKLKTLQKHRAYQSLTPTERAEVDARLESWHLDDAAVAAATGGLESLEASDLRFWLASTATRPWDRLSLCAQPDKADALFQEFLAAAPGVAKRPDRTEVIDRVRDFSRALVVTEGVRTRSLLIREEQLAELNRQLSVVESLEPQWSNGAAFGLLRGVGLAALAEALHDYQRETSGLMGLLERARRRLGTKVFDLVQGGLFVLTGAPDHEGHYRHGVWRNWTANYEVCPAHFHYPDSEEGLCRVVAQATSLRVVGSGHSFNAGTLCEDTMVSLDRYDQVLDLNPQQKTIRVQAGIRLRELNKVLAAHGLGLPVLGSTDAQSLAGLVATDLHGTGRDHGFLSEQLLSLRVINAEGRPETVRPHQPLFHAAAGGIGACGVIAEVELQLVDAYRIEKRTQMVDRVEVEAGIDALLAANEHVSFYYFGGADAQQSVRVHRWNRSTAALTENWEKHKARAELKEFAVSAYLPGIAEAVAEMDEDAWLSDVLAPDEALILPGSRAFGRKLFYRHDELEFGVPFAHYQACLKEILQLLGDLDFFSIVEVRFTPARSPSLLGPGAGRRTAYIELATPLSQVQEDVFARAEAILRAHGGQPHLGKKTTITAQEMLELHGERFIEFQRVRAEQDPGGKFLNGFTRRVFGAG